MATLTTYGDISRGTAFSSVVRVLNEVHDDTLLGLFGQAVQMPKNKGQVITFSRCNALATAETPLQEGVPPAGQKPTYTRFNCQLQQYGDVIHLTDVIMDTAEDPVLQDIEQQMGPQIAETLELVRYGVLKAGTNVYYANGVSGRTSVTSPATPSDFDRIYRQLTRSKAKPIKSMLSASDKYGTAPVAPAFIVLCHSDCKQDLERMAGFVPVESYADSSKALPHEIGKYKEFRFLTSTLFAPWLAGGASGTTYLNNGVAPASSAAADVYPMLVIGADAYGTVALKGLTAIKPAVVNPTPSKDDPLGQRGFVSWKTWQAAVILNQSFMARLEVAASALS